MKLHELKSSNYKKTKKRLGRGPGSGRGKTSTRGHKGQKSRSGFNIPKRFEGGQTSFIQRVPKAKGQAHTKRPIHVINLGDLDKRFSEGEVVSPKTLYECKLTKNIKDPIKILSRGKLTKKLIIRGCAFSQAARASIAPKTKK